MTKFEEEFNYLIELSGKVLIGQVDAEAFEKNRIAFFEKYETDQQQALPVVPECVADEIKRLKQEYGSLRDLYSGNVVWLNNGTRYLEGTELDLAEWVIDHESTFENAWLDGYTVEKPQLFYLKNMLTGLYLACDAEGYLETGRTVAEKFTQQEIDSVQTGSYKQIEVEE